jgi:hypothetical protein
VNHKHLTIQHAQDHQPWTVPYAAAIDVAAETGTIPHILATHTALHAMKSVGKLATVFEALDHSRNVGAAGRSEYMTYEQLLTIRAMSADLLTAALRFANLYHFDLAEVLLARIKEKNGIELEPMSNE